MEDIESDGEDVDSFDDAFEDDVGELDSVADAEDIGEIAEEAAEMAEEGEAIIAALL